MNSGPPTSSNPALPLGGLGDGLSVPRTAAEQKPAPAKASDKSAPKSGTAPKISTKKDSGDGANGDLRGPGRIVTVLKTDGGCGASMLASNLAGEFARLTNEDVGLVDLDVQFGNLALYLDMHTRHTLLEALQADTRLDETLLRSLMAAHETGVILLAAPRHMVPLDMIEEEFIIRLFRLLKQTFPVTVIELPAGWCQWFSTVFERSDEIVIVCEPELRSASGLTRVIQSLEDMSIDEVPLCVIANKVRKGGEAGRRLDQMRATVPYAMETICFDDKAVDRAVNAGMLLHQTARKTKAYKDIEGIAARLMARLDPRGVMRSRGDKGFELRRSE